MQPDSVLWKALEFYGTRIRHRGKWRVHNYLRELLHADYDGELEVERLGLRWRLNPSDFVQTHLYWTGEYESWDLFHLARLAQPGSIIFDVGANFGFYSLILVSSMRKSGHVFAFEPSAVTFSRLQSNLSLNQLQSFVTPTRCALSNKPGLVHLAPVAGNSGATSFALDQSGEEVAVDTLDNFYETNRINRIDLIKIDVEGNELRVLEGGRNALARWKPAMMIEFNDEALERAGASVQEMQKLLRDLGYRLYVARRERLIPCQIDDLRGTIVNAFCISETTQALTC